MKVLVTGASGFVGGNLVPELLERGHRVTAIVHRHTGVAASPMQILIQSFDDTAAWAAALDGIDAVVHLAARVHVLHETASDPLRAFRDVNTSGTNAVARSAAAAGVKHFIFLSSLSVVGQESTTPWTDDIRCTPVTDYGRSKLEAENLIEAIGASTGMTVTSLRPPLTYGPGMTANMLRFFHLVARGVPLPFATLDNRRSYISVGNLCASIRAALAAREAVAGRYFVSDCDDMSTPRLATLIGDALGMPARLFRCPARVLALAGQLGDLMTFTNRWPINSGSLRQLTGNVQVCTDRFAAHARFHPPHSVHDGIRRAADWYSLRNTGKAMLSRSGDTGF